MKRDMSISVATQLNSLFEATEAAVVESFPNSTCTLSSPRITPQLLLTVIPTPQSMRHTLPMNLPTSTVKKDSYFQNQFSVRVRFSRCGRCLRFNGWLRGCKVLAILLLKMLRNRVVGRGRTVRCGIFASVFVVNVGKNPNL